MKLLKKLMKKIIKYKVKTKKIDKIEDNASNNEKHVVFVMLFMMKVTLLKARGVREFRLCS